MKTRPPKPVDLQELEKLGALQATHIELAAWFNLSPRCIEERFASDTLYDFEKEQLTFREVFERGQARGRVSLRRKQVELALGGNVAMLIWLGKQILGQRDMTALEHSATGESKLEIIVTKVGNRKSDEDKFQDGFTALNGFKNGGQRERAL